MGAVAIAWWDADPGDRRWVRCLLLSLIPTAIGGCEEQL
jgi:hypothetical protein